MAKAKKIDKDMGFRLKKARLDQKLTYDELSEMSGVSSRYINGIYWTGWFRKNYSY